MKDKLKSKAYKSPVMMPRINHPGLQNTKTSNALNMLREVLLVLVCNTEWKKKQTLSEDDDDGFGGSLAASRAGGRRALGRRNRLRAATMTQQQQDDLENAAASAVRNVAGENVLSPTKILPVSSEAFDGELASHGEIQQTQHEFQYHEEQLKSSTMLKKHRSMRRTSLRVDARKKI